MNTLQVEFHCHTIFSKDSLVPPAELVRAARQAGLDRVVVTDHNSIKGALRAQELAPDLVIVGEEIMTTRGEILAAFVTEEIQPGLEPSEVISRLREQGAFISVSHPFDAVRNGHWELADLLSIAPQVDAIEVFNSRCMDSTPNKAAQEFASLHNLAGTVGSDAHTTRELGRARLLLPMFTDAQGLRSVIRSASSRVVLSSPWIHLSSRYAVLMKKFGLVKQQG